MAAVGGATSSTTTGQDRTAAINKSNRDVHEHDIYFSYDTDGHFHDPIDDLPKQKYQGLFNLNVEIEELFNLNKKIIGIDRD